MSRFKYLGAVIPYTLGVVLLIVAVVGWFYLHPGICYCKNPRARSLDNQHQVRQLSRFEKFGTGLGFENVYHSPWGKKLGKNLTISLLLIWRFGCFCFFFGVAFLWAHIEKGGSNALYFTFWNIDLLCLYFFLATIASLIGVINESSFVARRNNANSSNEFWSKSLTDFGYAIQILYEIMGSTAICVTVATFTAINPHFVFWNLTEHFMNLMAVLVELSLNNMIIRWEHVLFTVFWGLVYLKFYCAFFSNRAATPRPY
jgi:hypothetical protein